MAGQVNSFGGGGLSLGCYDEQTEILTDKGWMLFKAAVDMYNTGESVKVITRNPNTNAIEYQTPTQAFDAAYTGNMHHYTKQGLDLMVTPNHNMFVTSDKLNKNIFKRSNELGHSYSLPRLGAVNNKPDIGSVVIGNKSFDSKVFFYFIGLYLGDGGTYHDPLEAKYRAYEIVFQAKKERKLNSFKETITALGFSFREYYVKTRGCSSIRFYSKDIWEYVVRLGKCSEKRIPRTLLDTGGYKDLEALYKGLLMTDGGQTQGTVFYTSSKGLADDFSELCIKLGYPTTTTSRIRKPSFFARDNRFITSTKEQYEVHVLLKDKVYTHISKSRKNIQYTGRVYCFEVPNHVLFVRRNGKVAWCGNSHRVVTVNLNRIALECDTQAYFFEVLNERLESCAKILKAHKQLIEMQVKAGLQPFISNGWINMRRMFSTVGIIGLYEAEETMKSNKLLKKDIDFIAEQLVFINNKVKELSTTYGIICNIEQIPGESMAVRLAQVDRTLFGEKNVPATMYSNQFIPLWEDATIWERLETDGRYNKLITGGGIVHAQIGEKVTTKQAENIIKFAVKSGCEHFALNAVYAQCDKGHTTFGKIETCPECGSKNMTYLTRIVGFFTKTSSWNKTRREWEFPKRKFTKLD